MKRAIYSHGCKAIGIVGIEHPDCLLSVLIWLVYSCENFIILIDEFN